MVEREVFGDSHFFNYSPYLSLPTGRVTLPSRTVLLKM